MRLWLFFLASLVVHVQSEGAGIGQAEAIRKTAEGQRLQKDHEAALAHWGIGRILLEHNAAEQGLPFFQKAVELAEAQRKTATSAQKAFPDSRKVGDYPMSVMYLDLGVCFGEVGQISKQISAFTKSLNLHYRYEAISSRFASPAPHTLSGWDVKQTS
eukprot:2530044-Rhodomonas_salina.2